jgi:hypothetical protein
MTSKSIIIVGDLDWFLTEKSMAVSLFVDVHIHFSLYDFLAFKTLSTSYLWLKDHKLFFLGGRYFSKRSELEFG